MATTVLQVFDLAMNLMDNVSNTGLTDTAENAEYKRRTVGILNVLRAECYPFSDAYASVTSGVRPISTLLVNYTDNVGLDDAICQTILPYGLAAQLMLDEDMAKAAFFNDRYEQLKNELKNRPAEFAAIEDIYGGIEYGEFSSWDGVSSTE